MQDGGGDFDSDLIAEQLKLFLLFLAHTEQIHHLLLQVTIHFGAARLLLEIQHGNFVLEFRCRHRTRAELLLPP